MFYAFAKSISTQWNVNLMNLDHWMWWYPLHHFAFSFFLLFLLFFLLLFLLFFTINVLFAFTIRCLFCAIVYNITKFYGKNWLLFKNNCVFAAAISSTNLQIGNNNTMNVTSSPMEPAKVIDEESLKPYLGKLITFHPRLVGKLYSAK